MKKGQPRIDHTGMWYRAESSESTNALNILSEEAHKRGISYGELMKTTDSLERYEIIRAYAAFPDDQNPDDTKAAECIGCRYWKSAGAMVEWAWCQRTGKDCALYMNMKGGGAG